MYGKDKREFSELKGKILTEIIGQVGDDEMIFKTSDDDQYKLYHEQYCCESVTIDDIVGDINDLLNSPILLAEEVTNENENPDDIEAPEFQDGFTWSFYKLSTIKGSVTIKWYGESSGYYSESVDFIQL